MTIFEQVSSVLNNTKDLDDLREFSIYWCAGDKYATVNVPSISRYASRIRKLAEKFPEDVRIFSETEYMVASVPTKAVKISIIEGRQYSEEEKEALRVRLSAAREFPKTHSADVSERP